jgi:hypothetical protein
MNANKTPSESDRLRDNHHLICGLTAWLKIPEPASASLENAFAQLVSQPK